MDLREKVRLTGLSVSILACVKLRLNFRMGARLNPV